MVLRLLIQTAVSCAAVGALLFIPAGTTNWPAAWALLAEIALGSLLLGGWLAKTDRGLLAERLSAPMQSGQRRWDQVLVAVLLVSFVGWTTVVAVDAVRFGWSHVPQAIRVLGALGPAACYWITLQAFRANSFASPVVKLDATRSHLVADTGPYAVVRHPMYSGAGLFILGAALLLGSWVGVATAAVPLLLLAVRAVAEERLLGRELPGYAAYAQRVRSRIIPGVW